MDNGNAGTPAKSLYMMTLGCPKNRVDSEVMLGTLTDKGAYQLVDEPESAQVIVTPALSLGPPSRNRWTRFWSWRR